MKGLPAAYTASRWLIAVILVIGGLLTWRESGDLMLWLIWKIGEERALGPDAVDGKLLTNPVAMMFWTLPFWVLGFAMIAGGLMLMFQAGRVRSQASGV